MAISYTYNFQHFIQLKYMNFKYYVVLESHGHA